MSSKFQNTELGAIPAEWSVASCADVCVKIQDGTHFSPKMGGQDYLYVTSKNIRFGFLDLSSAEKIDATQHASIYKRCDVRHGDLLLTKDGANTGNAAMNTVHEEISLLSSVAFLRFDETKHNAVYYLQQILSTAGQWQIQEAMSGNAITRLTLDKIKRLKFPVPPLPEQTAIAEALSDADALITSLEKLIEKKRAIKQGAMQELLTGKRRLPGFSGEWVVKKLGECLVRNPQYGINAAAVPLTDALPTYLRITDITEDGTFSRENMTSVKTKSIDMYGLKSGDLVFARTGASVGKTYLYDERDGLLVFAGFLIRVTPNVEILIPKFLKYYTQTRKYWNWVQVMSMRSGQPGINGNEYREIEFQLPKIDEQKAITQVLSDMDVEIQTLQQKLAKYRQIKQGMMQELLTGRIRLV